MNRVAYLVTFALLSAVTAAHAGYPYRAAATYAPSWRYFHSPQYPGYFVRGTSEHDIDYHKLYTGKQDAYGHWHYTPYVVPQLGSTVYGGSKTQYGLALELGYKAGVYVKPGVLKQLGDPAPLNAKDFLPDPAAQRQIDVEGAKKAFALVAEQQGQTDRAAIDAQLKERLAQIEASRTVAILQADERDQRLRQERLAILQRATSVSSSGDAGSDIPIADQSVRAVVSRNCVSCHGGDQGVKGGIDFRLPLTPDQESECKDQILLGLMPKGGVISADEQNLLVGYFKGRVKAALGTK